MSSNFPDIVNEKPELIKNLKRMAGFRRSPIILSAADWQNVTISLKSRRTTRYCMCMKLFSLD